MKTFFRNAFASTIISVFVLTTSISIVRADVLILTNGERREGIISPAPADPDAIMFQDSTGQIQIAKNRIRSMEKEPEATNLTKIGDQFYLRKRFEQALQFYKKAQGIKSDDTGIADRVRKAEAALESTASSARHEQLTAIDALLDKAEKIHYRSAV